MPFNKKEHHNPGEIRPRFRLITPHSQEEVMELIDQAVKDDKTVIGKRVYDMYYLDIPKHQQHYWSPELRISMEDNLAGEGTFLRCVVGPRQNVWLLFVFIYGFLSMVTLFGGMYGLVKWENGGSGAWLWCFPAALLLILSVYVVAKMGQRTGRDQMLHLVSVLYHSLGDKAIERK